MCDVANTVAVFPSLDAVITAVPMSRAVTSPLDVTSATLGALDDHVTVRVSTVPSAAFT